MYFYKYIVCFWEECEEEKLVVTGLTTGDTLHDALDKIVAYYGEYNIIDVKLSIMNNEYGPIESLIEMTDLKAVINDNEEESK